MIVGLVSFAQSSIPSGGPYYLQVPTSTWKCQIGIFSNGTYYMVNGSTWKVDYRSNNASQIFQETLDASVTGGTISIQEGYYMIDAPLVFPFGARSITIEGANGWGKSDTHSSTFLESTITNDALFKTTPTINLRSAFGLEFSDLIVSGPKTTNSKGFLLTNVDTFEFSSCTILGFDIALNVSYQGTTLAEQPGMGFIHDCIWAEGATATSEFMFFDKCTEVTVSNCVFGWETFTRAIHIKDCNKIRVGPNNEFNIGDTPSPITEYIYIESSAGGSYIPNQIDIHDNWAYCELATNKWIRTVDAPTINVWGVKSVDNTIECGYSPDFFVNSTYAVSNWTNIVARDLTYPPCQPGTNLQDLTVTCPATVTYQNKWAEVSLSFLFNIPATSGVAVGLSKDGVNWAAVYVNDAAVNNTATNLVVPTLWYWHVNLTGSATQYGLWGIYG